MTDDEMVAELRAKGYRIEPPLTPETCKHPRLMSSGMVGMDGSTKLAGLCPDCGYSYSYETPPRPDYDPMKDMLWNSAG